MEIPSQQISNLVTTGMKLNEPDTAAAISAEANRFGGFPTTMESAESLRARLRHNLNNAEFYKTQKSDAQELDEAKHRGVVAALENAFNQINPDVSLRNINMSGGRLDKLGDRLAIRSIGAQQDPAAFSQALHAAHIFGSTHGGVPYLGVFGDTSKLGSALLNPRGTNIMARRAMSNFGRPNRVSVLNYMRGNYPKVNSTLANALRENRTSGQ